MTLLILLLLEVGHDTVDNMLPGSEKIEGVDIAVSWSAVGDLFDVWSKSGKQPPHLDAPKLGFHTCDVLVQNGILVHDIVDDAPTVAVDYENFPLEHWCVSAWRHERSICEWNIHRLW